jgi:hypothetical protein
MKLIQKRKCRCCKDLFSPNYRSAKSQRYCNKPECRRASKVASQRRWFKKNPTYFSGSDNVERVLAWRKANPGWQHRKISAGLLQENCSQITDSKQDVSPDLAPLSPGFSEVLPLLQDICMAQQPVFVGLLSHLTGCVLQDEIASITLRLEQLGQDVISARTGGRYETEVPNLPRPYPQYPGTVQLGGSPSGP